MGKAEPMAGDPVFEAWKSAWLSAYSRLNPILLETPVPDWALQLIYAQNKQKGGE
jgi:hypothetical protein